MNISFNEKYRVINALMLLPKDLRDLRCGIPPGQSIGITLFPNLDTKRIDSWDGTANGTLPSCADFIINIRYLCLHVPIAVMTKRTYNSFLSQLLTKPMFLRFKRFTTRKHIITANTSTYQTDLLFGTDVPFRMVCNMHNTT